jgi:hypothetical protein
MPLDADTIQRLTAIKARPKAGSGAVIPKVGPLRFMDKDRRCASRGCGTMTHYSVQGVARCVVHALEEMNEMLVGQGFKGIVASGDTAPKPTPIPQGRLLTTSVVAKLSVGHALERFQCIHGINLSQDCNGCKS